MWRILRLWPAFQASRPGPGERPAWPGGLWWGGGAYWGLWRGGGGGAVPATPAIILHLQHRNGGGGGGLRGEKIYDKINENITKSCRY